MKDMSERCARVLVTSDCNRNCPYCVNEIGGLAGAQRVSYAEMMEALRYFGEVAVTGGEPMLDPPATAAFIAGAKMANPKIRVWLYTAWFEQRAIFNLLPMIDGLTFTLHGPVKDFDEGRLMLLQTMAPKWPVSFRLRIGPGVNSRLLIVPSRWSSIRSFGLGSEDCALPENEVLYVLKEETYAQDKV